MHAALARHLVKSDIAASAGGPSVAMYSYVTRNDMQVCSLVYSVPYLRTYDNHCLTQKANRLVNSRLCMQGIPSGDLMI